VTSLKGHYNLNSAAVRVGVTVSDGVRNKNKLHLWLRRTFDITVFRYGGPEPDQNRGGGIPYWNVTQISTECSLAGDLKRALDFFFGGGVYSKMGFRYMKKVYV